MRITLNPITGKLDMAGDDITAVENASFYSSDIPTPEAHGGIEKGATFDNVPIATVLDRILHKPQPPVINNLSASKAAGVYELGSSYSVTLTCKISAGTSNIVKVELYKGSTVLNTWDENTSDDLTITHTLTINATATYKFVVTASDGRTAASSLTYSFVRPIYYGLADASTVPSSISGLSKVTLATSTTTYTANYPAFDNKRFVFAVRGSVSKALNPSLFDITKSLSSTSITVTCLDGQQLAYTLYYSEPNTQSKAYPVKYTFKIS